ncbi:MAG: hypothetical protein AABX72_04755 [Nanoarchaeota archaeon]
MMGLIIFMTDTHKRLLIGSLLAIFSLLILTVVLLIRPGDSVDNLEINGVRYNQSDIFTLLDKEPVIVERKVNVPTYYVVVNGKNYTAYDVMNILEASGVRVSSFDKWVQHIFDDAQEELSLLYSSDVYGPGEYLIEDVESSDCYIEFDHGGFDEGVVSCHDIDIETESGDSIQCDIEVYFKKNTLYEHGKIKNCARFKLF